MNPIKNGRITTDFNEMRPLSVPVEKRNHVHGALDISYEKIQKPDKKIYAPCDGYVFGYQGIRHPSQKIDGKEQYPRYWPKAPIIHGKPFLWCNYFYDMYGGVIVLEETDSDKQVINTHLICHSWGNQLFNKSPLAVTDKLYVEESKVGRWPIHAWYTGRMFFRKGDHIGCMGSAGYSTGLHIHWEIHPGTRKVKHADRIRPTKYLEE